MKIFKVEKFQPEKSNITTDVRSQTKGMPNPEAEKEYKRREEKTIVESANGDTHEQPKGVDDIENAPEVMAQDPQDTENRSSGESMSSADQGMQKFFVNLPNVGSERKSNNHAAQQTQANTANGQEMEDQEKIESFTETGKVPIVESASGSALRSFNFKAISKARREKERRPQSKKKYSGDRGGEFTEPPKISTRDVLNIVFKRKLQIFVFFLTVLAMVIIGSLLLDPIYKASSQILVKLGRESMYVPTGPINAPFLNIDRAAQVNSEIEILKSQSLTQKVIATIGLAVIYENFKDKPPGVVARIRASFFPDVRQKMSPDERKAFNFDAAGAKFKKALEVTGVKKSNVIQVDFKHKDPQMAAMVVNKLAELYRDHHLLVHKRPQNVKFFEKQSHLLKIKLNQTEARLKALRKKYNITSLEEQRPLLLGQIAELNSKVNETKSLAVETERRIHELRRQLSNIPNTISQGEVSDKNPYLINTLEARLVELQLKEKELLAKYTDQNRLVQNVKEEIKVVNKKLSEQETRSFGKKTSVANPVHQQVQEDLFRNESEVEALKAKGISQAENLTNLQREIEQLNSVEFEVNQLKQRIEVDQENYHLYLTKVEESRISDAMDAEKITSVSLISSARPPRDPVFPIMILNILIGIFLGTFGGLMLAFIREYLDDRIERIEDVEKELMLPVLASIPIFEKKAAGA